MAINKDTLDGIIAGLGAMPKKSEIDTPTNNIDLLATETSEGLMSAEDKVKLNNVETGANNYVLPSAGKDSLGGVKTTSDVNSTDGYAPTPIIDGVPYYKDTLYTLPIATADSLGGVKIGKNISISEDGAISVSDVSADQMTGIVPINKGGTGASNIHQARINLKTSCFVIVGNTTENDETNSGYYQAFSVPTIASVQYTLRLLISPVTPSYDFEEFTVDIKLNTSASEKLTPVGYMSTVEEQYDVINKLYVAYNASITTGGFYFWYKNTTAKSVIRISVLSCTYSNDITQDGLQTISLNTSGACTSQDTISTSTPNVVLFSDIITTKLATSSMAGYMSKEDKTKLDALDSTLTEQASQLTSLVNNAYNTIGSPSTTTTTSTDSSDIPYNETKTTVKYEFSKPNGGKSTVSSTDTVIKYKNASSSNAGLLSSTDYDYIHSLPDVLSALEETVTNDITTTLDAHVTDTNNPHSVTKAQIGLGNVENKTSATIRNEITKANVTTALGYTPVTPTEFTTHIDEFDAHATNVSNPHSVTKAQIGLSNVENKSSEDIRGEITSTNVIDALTYTPAKATDLTSHISNKSNPHSVTKAQIGLGNVENKTSEDIRGELTATNVTDALGYVPVTPTDLSDHTLDTNNPHSVTKAQVGLGNVENKSSATIRGEITKANVTTALGYVPVTPTEFTTHIDEFDDHVANVSNPHSVTKAQIGLGNVENKTSEDIRGELTATNVTDALTYTPAKATDLTSHISNKSNPHSVTKAQIGLDNVENKTSEDIRGELTATNVTTALGYTPVTPTDLSDHTSDTNNPHSVTKAQIGLGNVENKSSVTIRSELTKSNVTTALGYTPITPTEFTTHTDEFDAHLADTTNPHAVTKSQVGLGNVENKSSEDIRGELTSKNVTDALGYTPAKITDLASHTSNKSNPHSVTKAQIGLGNVENKSSADIRSELTTTDVSTALGYAPVSPSEFADHTSDTTNPHGVTKAQVGLGNVENKSSATIRGEITKANVTTALGYTPPSSVTFTQSITSGTKIGTLNVSGTGVDLYAPADIDTHWTSNLVVGASPTASSNETAGNGNVHLNLFENSTIRNSHKISGANGVSVTSNTDGEINITGTTYTAGTGLVLSGTKFNHSNSVTAGTAQGDSDKTLEFGGTFNIPTVTYDAQGHITGSGTTTLTMPSNPNTDTKVTSTLATTRKAYITGTTSATTNTGTLVFDTGVYLDTTAGRLYAKEFSEGGSLLSGKYRAHLACTVGQSSPVSDPWFKVGDIIFANYVYKNYDHMTTFRVFKPYADNARAVGILTTHIRTTPEGTFSSGELIWEYAGEGINIDNFKMACQPNSTTFTVELWVKIPYEWQYYHFDYIAAGNRTVIFNGVGWNLKSHAADGVASITEGYTIINSTLLKLKNPIADNQYLPTTGGLMTGNIGFHGSRCDREIIKFIDNTHDSSGQGIAIGGGGLTIIGGGESADAARDMYAGGDREDMLICNDYAIDFYSNCQNGMGSAKHYRMASGVITSESFNATSSYKINDKVAIKYNSTEECVNFVFS